MGPRYAFAVLQRFQDVQTATIDGQHASTIKLASCIPLCRDSYRGVENDVSATLQRGPARVVAPFYNDANGIRSHCPIHRLSAAPDRLEDISSAVDALVDLLAVGDVGRLSGRFRHPVILAKKSKCCDTINESKLSVTAARILDDSLSADEESFSAWPDDSVADSYDGTDFFVDELGAKDYVTGRCVTADLSWWENEKRFAETEDILEVPCTSAFEQDTEAAETSEHLDDSLAAEETALEQHGMFLRELSGDWSEFYVEWMEMKIRDLEQKRACSQAWVRALSTVFNEALETGTWYYHVIVSK